MKLFFIPGLGEEASIFDKILPHIPGGKILIENWLLLYELPEQGLTVLDYAIFLINKYNIQRQDVVTGHSMGGWIALQIKQLTGCRVIQVSSWTNGKKVTTIPLNRNIMLWMAKKGIGFNPVARKFLVWLYYRDKPSRPVFTAIFERMRFGDKLIIAKQLMIVFNPLKEPITVMPDLRIHAKGDHIIKPPDEPYVLVPGDHFSLYTYPETVYEPIVEFIS